MNRINSIIEELKTNIVTYYPELELKSVSLKQKRKVRRTLYSNVYEVDILNARKKVKTLMVKVPSDGLDYRTEFEGLKYLYPRFNSLSKDLSVVYAVDYLPQSGALVTEKASGVTLHSLLTKYNFPLIRNIKANYLFNCMRKCGEWLKLFHEITYTGIQRRINSEDFLNAATDPLKICQSYGMSKKLADGVLSFMKGLTSEVSRQHFPVSKKHGDFQPHNIMVCNGKMVVLDINFSKEDIVIKDVCNFLSGLNLLNLRLFNPLYSYSFTKGLENYFLRGYFGQKSYSKEVVTFLNLLGQLQQLDKLCRRNNYFVNIVRIVPHLSARIAEAIKTQVTQ